MNRVYDILFFKEKFFLYSPNIIISRKLANYPEERQTRM